MEGVVHADSKDGERFIKLPTDQAKAILALVEPFSKFVLGAPRVRWLYST
jgi:hypothetical protein